MLKPRSPIYVLLGDPTEEGARAERLIPLEVNDMGQEWKERIRTSFLEDRGANDGVRQAADRASQLVGRMLAPYRQAWTDVLSTQPEVVLQLNAGLVNGQSAELALTLALALLVIDNCIADPKLSPLKGLGWPEFAATGRVDDDGVVRDVGLVKEKIEAALRTLSADPKSCVFVPSESLDKEIESKFAPELKSRRVVPVQRLQDALDELAVRGGWAAAIAYDAGGVEALREPTTGNPFRGLAAFGQQQRAFLFGRDIQKKAILDRLPRSPERNLPAVLIHGASGSGKSSLMMGGILGSLLHGHVAGHDFATSAGASPWRPSQARTLDEEGLCLTLREHLQAWNLPDTLQATTFDRLAEEFVSQLREADSVRRWVLAIDQLEELFANAPDAQALDATLARLAAFLERLQAAGVWILATLRSEYLGWLGPLRQSVFRQDNEYQLSPPDDPIKQKEILREVITRPAELAAVDIEPALLERLETDAPSHQALPLLQFALDELYERGKASVEQTTQPGRGRVRLSLADYEALGGIQGAVNTKAQALVTATPESQREVLLGALARLARSVEGKSGYFRASMEWAAYNQEEQRLLKAWVDGRLLAIDGPRVEVAHEALLNHFETLKEWLTKHRELLKWRQDKLLHDMREWVSKQQVNEELLADKELKKAELAVRQQGLLSGPEKDYAQRSLDAARARFELEAIKERQRSEELSAKNAALTRSRWRLKWGAAALLLVSIGAVAGASLAWSLKREAEHAARKSEMAVTVQSSLAVLESIPDQESLTDLLIAFRGLPGDAKAEIAVRRAHELLESRNVLIEEYAVVDPILFGQLSSGRPLFFRNTELSAEKNSGRAPLVAVVALPGNKWRVASAEVFPGDYRPIVDSEVTVKLWRDAGTAGQSPNEEHSIDLPVDRAYRTQVNPPKRISFSPEGKQVLVQTTDDTLRLIDLAGGVAIGKPWRSTAFVTAVAFIAADGRRVLTGRSDGSLQIWDVGAGRPTGKPWRGHGDAVTSLAVLPDGKGAVTTSYDGTIRVWDLASGKSQAFSAPPDDDDTEPITAAALSPDGRWLLSGGQRGGLRVWDVQTGRPVGPRENAHSSLIDRLAFDASGRHFVSRGADGIARAWSFVPRSPHWAWQAHDAELDAMAYSPDGTFVMTADRTGTLRKWTISGERTVATQTWKGNGTAVVALAVSPDGLRFAIARADGRISLRDAVTGVEIGARTPSRELPVYALGFSPNAKQLIAGVEPLEGAGGLQIWDGTTGAYVRTSLDPVGDGEKAKDVVGRIARADILSMAFSPDGKRIVTGYATGSMQLWDAATGRALGERWPGHDEAVRSIAFSADGREIVTGSEDKSLRRWNAVTGVAIGNPMAGHKEAVVAVAYLEASQRIVSASSDGTVRYWSTSTGEQIGPAWLEQDYAVTGLAISPRDDEVLAATIDGRVHRFTTTSSAVKAMCGLRRSDLDAHLASGAVARQAAWAKACPLN